MQNGIVQCYRSRLKTRGYQDIHITYLSDDRYFVECIINNRPVSAVVSLYKMSLGLSVVPAPLDDDFQL